MKGAVERRQHVAAGVDLQDKAYHLVRHSLTYVDLPMP